MHSFSQFRGNAFAGKSSPIERRLGKILGGEVEIASDCLALCRQLPVLLLLPSSGFVVGCPVANTPTSLFTMLLFQKGRRRRKRRKRRRCKRGRSVSLGIFLNFPCDKLY